MCESKVILKKGDKTEIIMDEALKLEIKGDRVEISGILGEKKSVEAKIAKIDLEKHEIILEKF
ncbi:MAG: CooT family nickel-binding protein [Candidatus Hydrothermarchaeota archaeon]